MLRRIAGVSEKKRVEEINFLMTEKNEHVIIKATAAAALDI